MSEKPYRCSWDGPYSPLDEHRDFKHVFSSEAGERVLRAILWKCEGVVPDETQPHPVVAAYVSRVRLADWIRKTMSEEPVEVKIINNI